MRTSPNRFVLQEILRGSSLSLSRSLYSLFCVHSASDKARFRAGVRLGLGQFRCKKEGLSFCDAPIAFLGLCWVWGAQEPFPWPSPSPWRLEFCSPQSELGAPEAPNPATIAQTNPFGKLCHVGSL